MTIEEFDTTYTPMFYFVKKKADGSLQIKKVDLIQEGYDLMNYDRLLRKFIEDVDNL